jgi:hypothetical protein
VLLWVLHTWLSPRNPSSRPAPPPSQHVLHRAAVHYPPTMLMVGSSFQALPHTGSLPCKRSRTTTLHSTLTSASVPPHATPSPFLQIADHIEGVELLEEALRSGRINSDGELVSESEGDGDGNGESSSDGEEREGGPGGGQWEERGNGEEA